MAEFEFRVATEFNVVKVKISKEVQERIDRLAAEHRCIGCEEVILETDKERRGLCSTCYSGVRNAMKKHGASEKRLMEDGHLLPSKPGGRVPKNKFTAALCGREGEVA